MYDVHAAATAIREYPTDAAADRLVEVLIATRQLHVSALDPPGVLDAHAAALAEEWGVPEYPVRAALGRERIRRRYVRLLITALSAPRRTR